MKLFKFDTRNKSAITDSEARRLTSLFLDGSTSPDDEKKLYAYYGTRHVAIDLEQYKQMFAWYNSLQNTTKSVRKSYRHWAVAAGIAALVIAGIGLLAPRSDCSRDYDAESIYAGSYIIRDGKKISDINKILPELQRADRMVDSVLLSINKNYQENPDPERVMLQKALGGIKDSDLKEMLIAELTELP